jgi:hypothetical protein
MNRSGRLRKALHCAISWPRTFYRAWWYCLTGRMPRYKGWPEPAGLPLSDRQEKWLDETESQLHERGTWADDPTRPLL